MSLPYTVLEGVLTRAARLPCSKGRQPCRPSCWPARCGLPWA